MEHLNIFINEKLTLNKQSENYNSPSAYCIFNYRTFKIEIYDLEKDLIKAIQHDKSLYEQPLTKEISYAEFESKDMAEQHKKLYDKYIRMYFSNTESRQKIETTKTQLDAFRDKHAKIIDYQK